MRLLSSGFERLDKALGGGILEGTNILLIYDSFSLGWIMPFKILQYRLSQGDFGIIINYNLPLPKLALRAKSAGLDIDLEGKNGNLAIIDIFGSRYGNQHSEDYVYTIERFDSETYVPKLLDIYNDILEKAGNRRIIELSFTIDGMAFEIGEDRSVRILKHVFSNACSEERKRLLFSMYLLNKDRASKEFVSWNIELGDHVVEFLFEEKTDRILEQMYILKSPSFEFEPTVYTCLLRGSSIIIEPVETQRGVLPQTSFWLL
ncbi:hypothetical protein PAP_06990 [Palaeococcus pacificus DY20341]|uniref:KaiC-like domain-containing protein n=1 Tax=Palaeococcus pacificus DY20341 TaxID=1343739 RepID=A0A075LSQ8_9EURY|nr:hypothetical protein [Palaeococcus pacificus]AIF69790.1 hypothetical protein PAP_06990 [Palaeococcus pacificus DY20341]